MGKDKKGGGGTGEVDNPNVCFSLLPMVPSNYLPTRMLQEKKSSFGSRKETNSVLAHLLRRPAVCLSKDCSFHIGKSSCPLADVLREKPLVLVYLLK